MFCAGFSRGRLASSAMTFRFGVLQHSSHRARVCTVFVCAFVCVQVSADNSADRIGRLVPTFGSSARYPVLGLMIRPSVPSKKMQQDHHRFLNYTGPRCEVTLLQRSPHSFIDPSAKPPGSGPGSHPMSGQLCTASPLNATGRVDNRSVSGCGRETGDHRTLS
jgi:hypothetical protein